MPITTRCPACQQPLQILEEHLGVQMRCPHCGAGFTATSGPPPPAAQPPPPAPDGPTAALMLRCALGGLAAGLVGLVISLIAGSWAVGVVILGMALMLSFLAPAFWYMRDPCPQCKERWTVRRRWLHERADGNPDRRFNDNYQLCSGCGHRYP